MLRVARSLSIHLHLRLARHAHEWPVRWILLHHVSTHLWSGAIDELTLWATESSVLHARAHAILRHLHLLRVARHWLRLRTIHVRWHLARRRLNGRCRMRELHVRRFEVRWSLSRVGLYVWTAGCMLGSVALLHALGTLQMRRQLMLVRHRTVSHAVVRAAHLRRRCVLEELLVPLVLVRFGVFPGGKRAMGEWDASILFLVLLRSVLGETVKGAERFVKVNILQCRTLSTKEACNDRSARLRPGCCRVRPGAGGCARITARLERVR